jgi:hypothetical protein
MWLIPYIALDDSDPRKQKRHRALLFLLERQNGIGVKPEEARSSNCKDKFSPRTL